MVKIKNKRKLKWRLVNYDSGKIRQTWAASDPGITPRRFRQLYKEYKTTGQVPIIGVNIGRPEKEILDERKDIILKEYEAFRLNEQFMQGIR